MWLAYLQKKLTVLAENRKYSSLSDEEYYKNAVVSKKELISKLNKANYDNVASKGVEIIDGIATFKDDKTVIVKTETGEVELTGESIFVDGGTFVQTRCR
ncbi:hypothetical protein FL857_08480 [Criibacterium bergeronii]|uniref:Uncharacterized protein n=1 Tax=Criibacterium bergeronii TaxID=1871336 RepID=A0A552V232_9FIRM|nr:hypothetical protein [Criibacterium bergeronii]TRW24519.1 hypothetical protein FL857_08480 [Criibacterium bergeronii]